MTNVPPHASSLGDTYDEENPSRAEEVEAPRVPLCDLSDLQDLLLVRYRNRKDVRTSPGAEDDTHTIRKWERVERLPHDVPTPEKLQIYLQELERCGTQHTACGRARLTYEPVRRIRKAVPEFEELVQQALERYRETLEQAAYKRGVHGWEEAVFGGKDRDRVVGHVKRFDSRMLELMLKRHIPEYREKFEGEIRVTGGVLVVPAPALSTEEWAKTHGGEQVPQIPVQAQQLRGLPGQLPSEAARSRPEIVADSTAHSVASEVKRG